VQGARECDGDADRENRIEQGWQAEREADRVGGGADGADRRADERAGPTGAGEIRPGDLARVAKRQAGQEDERDLEIAENAGECGCAGAAGGIAGGIIGGNQGRSADMGGCQKRSREDITHTSRPPLPASNP
jgi:hypothetical protein